MKLGHQLEKDYEQQHRYESSLHYKRQSETPRVLVNQQMGKASVQCWWCKGHHPPGNCPWSASSSNQTFQQLQTSQSENHKNQGGLPSTNAISATKTVTIHQKNYGTDRTLCTGPQQLVIPIDIGAWQGKAILDTGASYTLLNESLWKELTPQESLQPWTSVTLYLANGKAEVPLGWISVVITLHGKSFSGSTVVLTSASLTYEVVLGLDFIFLSGIQLNVAEGKYFFKSAPEMECYFQPGQASIPRSRTLCLMNIKQFIRSQQNLSLFSAVPPPEPTAILRETNFTYIEFLIDRAIKEAALPPNEEVQLCQILESHPTVCTRRPGRTRMFLNIAYIFVSKYPLNSDCMDSHMSSKP